MKVLVIGSGGREHALTWKLAQSPRILRMWCAPGNAGIALEHLASNDKPVECLPIGSEDLPRLLAFARANEVDFTIVGPDNPLAAGIVDLFEFHRLRIWGPNRKAAQFEASKAFSQSFMQRHNLPTARSGIFADPKAAKEFARSLGGKCAVKADGLALGKGVLMCAGLSEAEDAIDQILVKRTFGAAGANIVVQEFLEGTEISLHALCDGKTAKLFPPSQDHKRAQDEDRGLNTGGMGAYCPAPFLTQSQLAEVQTRVLDPWLQGCAEEKIDFRGILYPGVMLTSSGPKVLEFNARFGDPETQVYLPRLGDDLLDLLEASADGTLGSAKLHWRPEPSLCVVMASAGYPGSCEKGKRIDGLEAAQAMANVKVFHAGTARSEGQIVTSGGRVLGVTGWGKNLASARDAAYQGVGSIRFEGAHWRKDIGAKALQAQK